MSQEIVGSIVIGCLPRSGPGDFSDEIAVSVREVGIGTKEAGSLWVIFNRGPVDVRICEAVSGDSVTLIPSTTGHLIQPTDHDTELCAWIE